MSVYCHSVMPRRTTMGEQVAVRDSMGLESLVAQLKFVPFSTTYHGQYKSIGIQALRETTVAILPAKIHVVRRDWLKSTTTRLYSLERRLTALHFVDYSHGMCLICWRSTRSCPSV